MLTRLLQLDHVVQCENMAQIDEEYREPREGGREIERPLGTNHRLSRYTGTVSAAYSSVNNSVIAGTDANPARTHSHRTHRLSSPDQERASLLTANLLHQLGPGDQRPLCDTHREALSSCHILYAEGQEGKQEEPSCARQCCNRCWECAHYHSSGRQTFDLLSSGLVQIKGPLISEGGE